jgi:hypothetical protein
MKLPRRNFLHLAAGAAALPAVSRIASAQTYPTRPVRMAEAKRMELRGSLGRSVRLFLQRNAVDSVETGSKRRHLSSIGAVVAPLIARQGLEVRLLYDPRHSGSHVGFAFLVATHVMKMMAHRQRRRMSLASVAWGD